MFNLNYLKRLAVHGSRLIGRVFMILLPVVGNSLWAALKGVIGGASSTSQEAAEYGVYSDGTPWVENIEHEAWETVYGKDAKRI